MRRNLILLAVGVVLSLLFVGLAPARMRHSIMSASFLTRCIMAACTS